MKIKKELAFKAEKERRKRKKGPEVVAIMDADNDDMEFSDAEKEEIQDVEDHEQAADLDGTDFMHSFMASRKHAGFGSGRNSYVDKVLERSRAGKELRQKMEDAQRSQTHHASLGNSQPDSSPLAQSQNKPYLRPRKGSNTNQGADQELVEIKIDK